MPGAGVDMHSQCQLHTETVWLSGEEKGKAKAGPVVDSDCESLGRRQPCALCSVGNGSTKGFPWHIEWESEGHAGAMGRSYAEGRY